MSSIDAGRPVGNGARRGAAALFLLVLVGAALLTDRVPAQGASQARPNFVVIQTDDQTLDSLTSTWVNPLGVKARTMPRTLDLLGRRGISFSNYYVSYPLCCPSRATLLTGRYSHSHGVISNGPPLGGWFNYQRKAIHLHNLPIWLQGAGYRTIHIGKFLNGYGETTPETKIPPGWNSWNALTPDASGLLFYGYRMNSGGAIEGPIGDASYSQKDPPGCPGAPQFGGCAYLTDVLTQRAVSQIQGSAPRRPFFLQLDYTTPHGDQRPPIGPEPAPRHYDSALDTALPKPPPFNEGDISDKPRFIRDQADRLDQRAVRRIRIEYQKTLESLRSVDEGVAALIEALRQSGELSNTFVFFTTDNGFFLGEHRLERAKFLPYEPAVHVPLLIRGPGIEPGSSSGELVANIDLAPTILKLARARADRAFDGRSLVPFWSDTALRTRRPILLESFVTATDIDGDGNPDERSGSPGAGASISAPPENYLGVRHGPYKYVEYEVGDRELYDLSKDPHELNNRVRDRRYDRIQAFLRHHLQRLEGCVGRECKLTTGPLPAPGRRGR